MLFEPRSVMKIHMKSETSIDFQSNCMLFESRERYESIAEILNKNIDFRRYACFSSLGNVMQL